MAGERSLLDLAGILDDETAEGLRSAVEERRERRSEALDDVAETLQEG